MIPLKINLPDDFFKAETICDYYVSEEVKKIWAVELDLMAELLRVCKKYNLKIVATDGTLLGFVRHHGFIPWDDDMDFSMPRKDYMKLIEVAPKEFKKPYLLQSVYTNSNYFIAFNKLMNTSTKLMEKNLADKDIKCEYGVYIDIFPFDNIPDDYNDKNGKKIRIAWLNKIEFERSKLYAINKATYLYSKRRDKYIMTTTFIRALIACSGKSAEQIVNYQTRICDKIYSQFSNKHSKLVTCPVFFSWKFRRIFNYYDLFTCTTTVNIYGIEVPIPIKYDEYLTSMYGDWRTPINKKPMHAELIYEID